MARTPILEVSATGQDDYTLLTKGRYLPILLFMRRKAGVILPLEASILGAAVELSRGGVDEFHGFELAKRLRDDEGRRNLTAHGTLYKALTRMEKAGLQSSVWEDADQATGEGRPRRRLYSITMSGRSALIQVEREAEALDRFDPGWSPS